MAKNTIIFKGKIRDGDAWIPFKVIYLESGFYELDLDDNGMNYAKETQFIHLSDALDYVTNNFGSW